ncbi:hypothetical protein LUZ60_010943 [Juncus effusus]|nr:hypothetical protein LUZ60_010943 [Juncus effusus]
MKRGRGRPRKDPNDSAPGSSPIQTRSAQTHTRSAHAETSSAQAQTQQDGSDQETVLDPKPLRTLSPMFPSTLGIQTATQQATSPPLIRVTPFTPFDSDSSSPPATFFPQTVPNGSRARPASNGGPIHATPISSFKTPAGNQRHQENQESDSDFEQEEAFSTHTSTSGRKIKRPAHFTGYTSKESATQMVTRGSPSTTEKPKKTPRSHKNIPTRDLTNLLSPSGDPREDVEVVLMTFDALRRRLLQLEELQDKSTSKRADLKAGAIMMGGNLRANLGKRLGPVPGVEIGDIFYFRMEMCIVGLHAPSMGGIDYMTKYGEQDEPVAICVVSAGGYDNDENDPDVLVYTGQGGNSDQKLERGNLALERSLYRKNEIRVVRGGKDPAVQGGKIYVYDGLYRIQNSWKEKGKNGFSAFKYKLVREKNQPAGMSVWKMAQKWIENPSSRGSQVIVPDLSAGTENTPVCLVNEVDDSKGPGFFTYITQVKYARQVEYMKPLVGCKCPSVCLPGDPNCNCAQFNGAELPYSSMGVLVSRKPTVYECTPNCNCTVNCRNRVTQKGVKLHFEVFKTSNKGWGLRSWDPIRAGTFICEYTGEVIDEMRVNLNDDYDEYLFQTVCPGEKTLKWNFGTELVGESSGSTVNSEGFRNLPIKISAKNMGNVARFMNHSCNPNCFWQPVLYDHGDEEHPHIMFFAMKHIPPLTELTFDYGASGKSKRCLCGSANCRGFFG